MVPINSYVQFCLRLNEDKTRWSWQYCQPSVPLALCSKGSTEHVLCSQLTPTAKHPLVTTASTRINIYKTKGLKIHNMPQEEKKTKQKTA